MKVSARCEIEHIPGINATMFIFVDGVRYTVASGSVLSLYEAEEYARTIHRGYGLEWTPERKREDGVLCLIGQDFEAEAVEP